MINYSMDLTDKDSYKMSLEKYLDDFERSSQKYILNNIEEIIEDIKSNENIKDLEVEETEEDKKGRRRKGGGKARLFDLDAHGRG